ncbi:gas vesicle protein GvpG [Alteribacillus iranensis]|uniref:Gas vesicle protein G n=1 Tax=Alteribacillus iranensis TaxID=930128 RepID=A0A1I2EJT4_9BACI|nr:gas vesicle protein GvpG [Alteribacillus iranensis]SFE92510.1 Gas vesicle protein G [Alteribacillus iranensis]
MIHKLFTWPLDTVLAVANKVKDEADKELYDIEHIQKKLAHLQMVYEMEEISEEEFESQEEDLLRRYRIAKEREQEYNQATKE